MYTYHASATGLDAMMPGWVQEGGHEAWVARLRDPAVRERFEAEIALPSADWENSYHEAGASKVLCVSFKQALKPLTGKSLAEIAALRGRPIDTAMTWSSRMTAASAVPTTMAKRCAATDRWVMLRFLSLAPEVLRSNPHPRAYGSFARLLGKYVRDEGLFSVEEAVRRLSALPADNLKLDRRGRLLPGHFADVVIFDPATIQDHATFDRPHQYATGVRDVLVNGVPVLRRRAHRGTPGRVDRRAGNRDVRRA
jgi:N-acyl-D-amino-acid deacylase